MNFLLYSSMMPSTRCSSAAVPSTVVTRAWVSPRWKRAEPWARGKRPTSHLIDRRSLRAAAVGPLAVEDQLADDPLLDRGEGRLDPAGVTRRQPAPGWAPARRPT